MKVLFHMRNPVYARNFERTIALLAERGHTVHIAFEEDKKRFEDQFRIVARLADAHVGVTWETAPTAGRSPTWLLATELRAARNYLRYLTPEYADADKLRARAERAAPAAVRAATAGTFRSARARAGLDRAIRRFESSLQPHARIVRYLQEHAPDLLLVTPLVQFGSTQTDYVRAARALGIRTCLPVFSWDNLTNKGLMHEVPDLVTVWNDAQREEGVRLQGVPEERIAVTGAVAYDHWFDWTPSTTREQFSRRLGLPGEGPVLLYVCSSAFIAPDEVSFVQRWLRELRAHDGPLRESAVIVRPHPMNAEQWASAELGDPGPVVIFPSEGEDPRDTQARANFYDSLYHSAAVVGLNTSAQIEAAIVGRPVHTVLAPEFRDTQSGTLHFNHLVGAGGGMLHVAGDWDEHIALLEQTVAAPDPERNRRFLEAFVRPHGLDEPASPRLAAELEALAERSPGRAPWRRAAGDRAVRRLEPVVRRALGAAAPSQDEPTSRKPDRKASTVEAVEAEAIRALDAAIPAEGPVLAGPWTSEVGFELLYWIPFLRWACERHPGLSERMIAVSRGGAASWYDGIASSYAEIFDVLAPDELRGLRGQGKQKQVELLDWERDLLDRVGERKGLRDPAILHPRLMYEPFKAFLKRDAVGRMDRLSRAAPLSAPPAGEVDALLPDEYVAVRFYWSHALPHEPATEEWVAGAVRRIAEQVRVVLLNTGMRLDDHLDADLADERIVRVDHLMTPSNNLAVQTRVAARASGFVGTYGGLSYLPCFLGVPSVCFYTRDELMNTCHLDTAARTFHGEGYGRFAALRPEQTEILGLLARSAAPVRDH